MARMASGSVAGRSKTQAVLLLLCFCSMFIFLLVPTANAKTRREPVKTKASMFPFIQSWTKRDIIEYLRSLGNHGFRGPPSYTDPITDFEDSFTDRAVECVQFVTEDVGCKPVPQAVEIPPVENGLTFPRWVMVDRCSDCCTSPLHVCGPKENTSETRRVEVFVLRSTSKFNHGDWQCLTVQIEEHKACECQCLIKAKDCIPGVQDYDADNCQCNCKDTTLSRQCTGNRKWSHDSCQCKCASGPELCPAGSLFDRANCQCQKIQDVCKTTYSPKKRITTTQPTTRNSCAHLSCLLPQKSALNGTACRCI